MFPYFENLKTIYVYVFMSQLQYKNENQNFLSNFLFQFIKKRNGTLGTRINQNIQVHISRKKFGSSYRPQTR